MATKTPGQMLYELAGEITKCDVFSWHWKNISADTQIRFERLAKDFECELIARVAALELKLHLAQEQINLAQELIREHGCGELLKRRYLANGILE